MRDRRRAINKTSGGKWRDRALNGRWMYDGRMRKTQTPFAKTKLTPSENGEEKIKTRGQGESEVPRQAERPYNGS